MVFAQRGRWPSTAPVDRSAEGVSIDKRLSLVKSSTGHCVIPQDQKYIMKYAQGLHFPVVAERPCSGVVDRNYLDREAKGARHQGVVAWAAKYEYVSLSEMLAGVRTEDPLIVVLDGVEDPQNLGSILRTSEAVSAHGVVIRRDRAAGVTVATIRAAAGATEHIPVAQVTTFPRPCKS